MLVFIPIHVCNPMGAFHATRALKTHTTDAAMHAPGAPAACGATAASGKCRAAPTRKDIKLLLGPAPMCVADITPH